MRSIPICHRTISADFSGLRMGQTTGTPCIGSACSMWSVAWDVDDGGRSGSCREAGVVLAEELWPDAKYVEGEE